MQAIYYLDELFCTTYGPNTHLMDGIFREHPVSWQLAGEVKPRNPIHNIDTILFMNPDFKDESASPSLHQLSIVEQN